MSNIQVGSRVKCIGHQDSFNEQFYRCGDTGKVLELVGEEYYLVEWDNPIERNTEGGNDWFCNISDVVQV